MASYWKSNDRKFCDICKCWFGDNRISIEFHERGKNHQENVKKKISELAKKGSARAKEEEFNKSALKHIEEAALAAAKKDLESRPDLASLYNVSAPEQGAAKTSEKDGVPTKVWAEALSEEGIPYYWHMYNGETCWDPPAEGFLTLQELNEPVPETANETSNNSATPEDDKSVECCSAGSDPDMPESTDCDVSSTFKPSSTASKRPFGAWETVDSGPSADELEAIAAIPVPPPLAYETNPLAKLELLEDEDSKPKKLMFKERTVTSLSSKPVKTEVGFKRRKITGGARNLKRRESDQDYSD